MVPLRPGSCAFFFFLLLGFIAFSTVSPSGSEITWHLRNYVALKTNPVDLLVRENPLSADKRCCILRKMGANSTFYSHMLE